MTDAPAAPGSLTDEPLEVEVTQSELVYEGHVWDVRSDTFRYGDRDIVRQYVDHPGAAAIVALDDDGRVLVIQHTRCAMASRSEEELHAQIGARSGQDAT